MVFLKEMVFQFNGLPQIAVFKRNAHRPPFWNYVWFLVLTIDVWHEHDMYEVRVKKHHSYAMNPIKFADFSRNIGVWCIDDMMIYFFTKSIKLHALEIDSLCLKSESENSWFISAEIFKRCDTNYGVCVCAHIVFIKCTVFALLSTTWLNAYATKLCHCTKRKKHNENYTRMHMMQW